MEDKKNQILDAAKNLFNRLGYAKTSVDDISQAVGMKKSSLYYYFKNKEDMFMCSFKDEWEHQFTIFAEEAKKAESAGDKIMAYITQSLSYYEQVVMVHKIPVNVLIETRNMYREFVDRINEGGVGFYKKCLQEGIDSGEFEECDTQKVAECICTVKFSIQYDSFNMFMHTYPTTEDWISIRESIFYAVRLIIKGLKKK
ncbi:MAG: TetR/AcrR family transcriptional regulator [Cyclobacteriaceae bacterium]